MKLSSRLSRVKPSATLAVDARAKELRARGVDVVGFGVGEPDFDTPAHIKDAAKAALDRGATKYTAVGGTPELKRAVASWLTSAHGTHGVTIAPDEVLVSCGAKHSLYNLFQALLDDGDEVLIPAPYWVSYPDLVALAGGRPVIVPTEAGDGFVPRAGAIARACTPRTRLLVLNSPSNPTGATLTDDDLAPVAKVCAERDVWVVSDDIYRALCYGVRPGHVARHGLRDRTIFIDGVSKAYAMTGWRIGFTAGPRDLIAAMETIQSQSTSNPAAVAQAAALAAITGPQDCVERMRVEFDARRRRMVELLRAIPGVALAEPRGAFYCFPDVRACLGRFADDVALGAWLLDEHKVAVVPGTPFGAPGFLRLSYATSLPLIEEGVARLARGLTASRAG